MYSVEGRQKQSQKGGKSRAINVFWFVAPVCPRSEAEVGEPRDERQRSHRNGKSILNLGEPRDERVASHRNGKSIEFGR